MTLTNRINRATRHVPVWVVYSVLLLPAPYYFYLALTGGLGPEPVKPLEHAYGTVALQLLILGLAVTPLRQHFGLNMQKYRRAIGVMAFVYVFFHLIVWALLDVQALDRVVQDILKRPYITIGMAGFALMIPLAATSNNWSLRKLGGAAWQKLHKLTYVAVLLGGLHFVWLAKGFQLEPLVYMALIIGLLALRMVPRGWSLRARLSAG